MRMRWGLGRAGGRRLAVGREAAEDCRVCPLTRIAPALPPPPAPAAGKVEVPPELAQELLEVADQYMLEPLKHLCEAAITSQLAPDNVSAAYDLAENLNAPELSKQCAMYCLKQQPELVAGGSSKATPGSYAILMQKMAPRLREAITESINDRASAMVS